MPLVEKSYNDILEFVRNTSKTNWNRHGELETLESQVPAFSHDPSSLDSSTQSINMSLLEAQSDVDGTSGSSITISLEGVVVYEVGSTVVVSDSNDIDRYFSGEVTESEEGEVTLLVKNISGDSVGSEWVVIRAEGQRLEGEFTNEAPDNQNLDGAEWSQFGLSDVSSYDTNGKLPSAFTLTGNDEDSRHCIYASDPFGTALYYGAAVFKAGTWPIAAMGSTDTAGRWTTFDLLTGQVLHLGIGAEDAGMIDLGDGFWLCWCYRGDATNTDTDVPGRMYGFGNENGHKAQDLDGETLHVALPQISTEDIRHPPTSLVITPPGGSAQIRSEDLLSIPDIDQAAWYKDSDEGAFLIECSGMYRNDGTYIILAMDGDDSRRFFYATGSTPRIRSYDGDSILTGDVDVLNSPAKFRAVITWNATERKLLVGTVDNPGTIQTGSHNGNLSTATGNLNILTHPNLVSANLHQLKAARRMLSDSEMQKFIDTGGLS